jgi:subtilisin family serine protease
VSDEDDLPAWSLAAGTEQPVAPPDWPCPLTPEWAFGGSTGAGVSVAIVDSGIEAGHPAVGAVERSVAVVAGEDGELTVVEDDEGDVSGHGTACAGIIRRLAPDVSLTSVRVLGAEITGAGAVLLAGLEWAMEQSVNVVNMSLSTRKADIAWALRGVVDRAYFARTVVVASAHNSAVESYPWRFASVLSVGSHEERDDRVFYVNPDPPVEFFGRGVGVEAAWLGGGFLTVTGNSFATPHLAGFCALVLGKHPGLTPFQVKTVLSMTAANVRAA